MIQYPAEYRMITADSAEELSRKINELFDGSTDPRRWQPHGPTHIESREGGPRYYQAMIQIRSKPMQMPAEMGGPGIIPVPGRIMG